MNMTIERNWIIREAERLIHNTIHNPHQLLGYHQLSKDDGIIVLWRPGAKVIYLEVLGEIVEAQAVNPDGVFVYHTNQALSFNDYRVYSEEGSLSLDPYQFTPTLGDVDLYLYGQGVHYELYRVMGAHPCTHQGIAGVRFAVWAPSALAVNIMADFNHWSKRLHPMRALGDSGVWELFIPTVKEGDKYKYCIRSADGRTLIKADPFALGQELRPKTASIIRKLEGYEWSDQNWMKKRAESWVPAGPINVYEVHLSSWKQKAGHTLNYRELAELLSQYCKKMAYTHVELMPVAEYPYDESWGYQVSSYFAPTSRHGSLEDFKAFVDHMHQENIGVIVDWVPAHFPDDEFALAEFDGTFLYEHQDEQLREHPHWGTHIFNYGRNEVSNFLLASALFWAKVLHVDGLRVDAVASMLYLDYGREAGEWQPNINGGNENYDAIEFLKHFNSTLHQHCPGVMTIAEESSSFPGVSRSLESGGLGFDMKWNMGWMNDTLSYFSKDPFYRHHHHHHLTFGQCYAYSENFMLVLSHDEVVHEKNHLISKMPGDYWQQMANLRLLLSYMICQPGKKLLFMSSEFGQWNEWNCKKEIDWNLLDYPAHKGVHKMVEDINHFYLKHRALWERDFSPEGFQWVDLSDQKNSVIIYLRKSSHEDLLCIHNFTPAYIPSYFVALGNLSVINELFNSDAEQYGGSNRLNTGVKLLRDHDGTVLGINVALAPLATMIFGVKF
jgi:1,4-alpha-glucan branching enzyme